MNNSNYFEKFLDEIENVDYSEVEKARKEYRHPVHGRIVESFHSAFHDVNIYEDGYEEYTNYIGD